MRPPQTQTTRARPYSACILAALLCCSGAWPQRAQPQRYAFVATFVNQGADPDDAWVGVALRYTLLLKLSYVESLRLLRYDRDCPSPLYSYEIPDQGLAVETWLEEMSRRAGYSTPVILGTYTREGEQLSVDVWWGTRRKPPSHVANAAGQLDEMNELLDEMMPSILAALNVTAPADRPWEGKAMTRSVDALEWFCRGMLAYGDNRDEAGLDFTSALDEDDSFIEAHWMRADVARYQREPLVALEHLTRVTEVAPDSARPHYSLAGILRSLGDYDDAIHEYQAAISLDPSLRRYGDMSIIQCYQRINDTQKAIEWGEESLADIPDNPYVLRALGQVYQYLGDYEKAIAEFEACAEAAKKRGPGSYAWLSREYIGQCYEAMGKLDEAAQQYELAIQSASKSYVPRLRQALAKVRERQGNDSEAISEWRKVLELADPGSDAAAEAKEKLKELEAR